MLPLEDDHVVRFKPQSVHGGDTNGDPKVRPKMVNTMETNHGLPSPFSSSVGIAQVTQPPSLPTCPVTALFDPGTLDGRALGQPLPLCLPGRIGSQGSLQATLFLFPRGADMVAFVPWSDCLTRFPAGKCCEGPWTAAANQPPATAVPCAGSQLSNGLTAPGAMGRRQWRIIPATPPNRGVRAQRVSDQSA